MKEIKLVRIDDRLIHGQVMTAWIQFTQALEVVIVDDIVAKDDFTKMIMQSAIPKKIKLNVFSVEKAVSYFLEEEMKQNHGYFILVKNPETIEKLIKAGVPINQVCIGGMGAKPNRKSFYRNISASEEEVACLHRINDRGVHVFAQVLTDHNPVDLKKI